jgi:hypothetical protein
LTRDVGQINKQLDSVQRMATTVGTALGVAFGGAAVVAAVKQFAGELLQTADHLTKLSDKTGVGVVALQELAAIAEESGNQLEDVTSAISKMQKGLAGGDAGAVSALNSLHLSFATIRSLSPDQQFIAIGKAIGSIEDPAERTRLAIALFGKSGAEILPTLRADIDEIAAHTSTMSVATIAWLDKAGDAWSRYWRNAKAITAEVAMQVTQMGLPPGLQGGGGSGTPALDALRLRLITERAAANAPKGTSMPLQTVDPFELDRVLSANHAYEQQAEHLKKVAEAAHKAADAFKTLVARIHDIEGTKIEFKTLSLAEALTSIGKTAAVPTMKDLARFSLRAATDVDELRGSTDDLQRAGRFLSAAMVDVNRQFATLPRVAPAATAAIKEAREEAEKSHGVFATMGDRLQDLWKGMSGGAGMSGLFKNLGGSLIEGFGKMLSGGLTSLISGGLGLAVKGLGSLFGKLFGGEGRKTNQMRDEFLAAAGGAAALQEKAALAGVSLDAIFGAKDRQHLQAAIDGVNQAFKIAEQKAKDVATAVDGVLGAAQALGGNIPAALQPMIDKLLTMNGLTADQKKLLGDLAKTGPDFAALEGVAASYGIKLADLGPAFQQANISRTAHQIYDDFTNLKNAGADVDNVLKGMSPKMNTLLNDALKFGSTIPLAMKPMLDKMLEMGLLTDDGGKKLTDLSKFNFDDSKSPLDKSIDKLTLALDHLANILNGLPGVAQTAAGGIAGALNSIPDKHVRVYIDEVGKGTEYAARGGLVTAHGIQYFASGGNVLPFMSRGTDTVPAMLTPGEVVLNRRDAQAYRNGGQVVDLRQVAEEMRLARLERRREPERIAAAVASQLAKVKVGR